MKKLTMILGLLVLLGSTGMASAEGFFVGAGPRGVAVGVSLPGFRLVTGRPGIYGWYQGRYYSRAAWERYCRLHRDRFACDRDSNRGRDRYQDGRSNRGSNGSWNGDNHREHDRI